MVAGPQLGVDDGRRHGRRLLLQIEVVLVDDMRRPGELRQQQHRNHTQPRPSIPSKPSHCSHSRTHYSQARSRWSTRSEVKKGGRRGEGDGRYLYTAGAKNGASTRHLSGQELRFRPLQLSTRTAAVVFKYCLKFSRLSY